MELTYILGWFHFKQLFYAFKDVFMINFNLFFNKIELVSF